MNQNGKFRIILLDDSAAVREVISELLTYRGYEVFAFSKPTICPLMRLPECRCERNQSCADVILTDMDMPEVDGNQFIENLKQKNCKCRHVAIMTGWLTPGGTSRAIELGCQIFRKPFETSRFFKWLEDLQLVVAPSRELCNWFQRSSHFG